MPICLFNVPPSPPLSPTPITAPSFTSIAPSPMCDNQKSKHHREGQRGKNRLGDSLVTPFAYSLHS